MKQYTFNPDNESEAERAFMTRWIQLSGLGANYVPEREWRFDPARKWRFDFAWPSFKLALEVEGGTWQKRGGHTTGMGYQKDCEKYNHALELGWRVLRYTPQMVEKDPQGVIDQIVRVIGA